MKANDETNTLVPFFGQSNASTAQQVMSKLKVKISHIFKQEVHKHMFAARMEFGRESRKFVSGVRKYGKFSHFLTLHVGYFMVDK